MNIIEIKNLSKHYEKGKITTDALKNLSFAIQAGDIVGLVGPNGAGKSTLIKIISGIMPPSRGEVRVLGQNPFAERKRLCHDLGIMFGQRTSLWYNIPVMESLLLNRDIYGIKTEDFRQRVADYGDALGVTDLLNTPVRKLSFGQKIKCELLSVLLHNPKLIILDEPTIGLDIVAKQSLRNALAGLVEKYQTTILITSHDIQDIQRLCNRVVFINQGEIKIDLSKIQLEEAMNSNVILMVEERDETIALKDSPFYSSSAEKWLRFKIPKENLNNFVNKHLLNEEQGITFQTAQPSLEDILYEYYA